jgi:RNA polymerase sigma-70 factor (ECF subfamily)
MSSAELINMMQTDEVNASKIAFERYYGRLYPIASRYSKSSTQADELLNKAFNTCLHKLRQQSQPPLDLDFFIEREFITEAVNFVRSIRSEYYVSSTVNAINDSASKNYDLFDSHEIIDFKQIDNEILIKCLQQLVPSQRLIFNLHIVDGFSLTEAASLLESSEGTVKSNLEKARFSLQKNIEKTLKSTKA